jgi:hypothetical protein
MNRTVKIGILIVIIVCVSTVTAMVILKYHVPSTTTQMQSTFEDIMIETTTDENTYNIGEDVEITGTLFNPSINDTALYCEGALNEAGEFVNTHPPYMYNIYNETYHKVWGTRNERIKFENLSFNSFEIYTININASSNYSKTIIWNQTTKNSATGLYEQVPSGTYHIEILVPLYMPHYYQGEWKYFTFGDSKTILIE